MSIDLWLNSCWDFEIYLRFKSRKLSTFVCFRCTCTYTVVLKYFLSVSSVAYSKTGDIFYKAQSQDEDALVHAAARLHMVFVNKNANILGKSYLPFAVIEST